MRITTKAKAAFFVSVFFLFVVFITVKVVNNFNLTNNIKVADEVRTEFDFSKVDCDGVDLKNAKGFVSLISRFGGLFTQVNVTINNFSPMVNPGADCLSDFSASKANAVAVAEDNPPLKNVAGLDRVVAKMLQAYNSSDYRAAVDSANLGLEMITPVLKPYLSRSFSIEARFAFNASVVYAVIAEDAWSRRDYPAALTNVGYAASLTIGESKAEMLAMARAIHLDERGGGEDVIPSDVLALLKGVSKNNKADLVDFLYCYINALARSGYILPILEDENGKSWRFDASEYFGFKERIDFHGVFKMTNMMAKDGTPLRLGKWFTTRHAGLGKLDMAMVGDAEERFLEPGFDMKKYHWRSTEKVVGKQLSLSPIKNGR